MSFKDFLNEGQESYITDFGKSTEAKPEGGGQPIKVGRYGVWKYDPSKKKHVVVATGDDLEELKQKHGTTKVVQLNQAKPVLPMQRRAM